MRINDRDGYIADIDERYVADALNSLSIEGYEVSEELIQRVQDGKWEPDADARDHETKNALAAKGTGWLSRKFERTSGRSLMEHLRANCWRHGTKTGSEPCSALR